MRIVPLKQWHLDNLDMQEAQDYVAKWLTPDIKATIANTMAFAAVEGDRVLACSGVIEMWENRGVAWAMLARDLGNKFIGIHRAVAAFLDASYCRRIEATVDIGHVEGERWMKMLGFRLETPLMKAYLPNGGDASMWVRGFNMAWHPASPDYHLKIRGRTQVYGPAVPFLMAASTVISTLGAISSAKAESSAMKYNAAVNEQNARIAKDNAASSAEQKRIENYRRIGSIKANYGASGVSMDGSPMDVLTDSYTQGEYDVQTILYEGDLKAAGYQNSANLDRASAKNTMKSGYINAASTALLGGAKTAGSFKDRGYFS